ncbi:subtilisin-like protein [Sistotremastrum suecicum HHB10207 ss-3]|uniref:tripeptidyl-peptidase II n=1 Tax=Sistotremastrum suecicum HHB10207 ss-3 TaxID=1314776 RepID=A0A165ZA11_9AGAM|nr:subtilisin-like protein [Sistotremastrum suecicum HHB10207 ss-3]
MLSLLAFALLATAFATPITNHVVHEKRSVAAASWSLSHRASPDSPLPLRIGLKQSNIDKLYDELLDISHPDSPNYGNHWSPQQVADYFRPGVETVNAVKGWLVDSGFEHQRMRLVKGGQWLEMNVTVAEAEELLKAEYHVYEHPSGRKHHACNSYSVPAHIQEHIELITPTVAFDALIAPPKRTVPFSKRKRSPLASTPVPGAAKGLGDPSSGNGPKLLPGSSGKLKGIITELEQCDEFITPVCLQTLYDIIYKPVSTHKNSYGITEFTPQSYLPADLDMFFKNFSKSQIGQRPNLISIDGGELQTIEESFNFNGESDLDLEYGMTLTNPQPITLYQTGDIPEGASFNNLLDALDGSYCTFEGGDDPTQDGIYPDPLKGGFDKPESCGIVKPANVISTSYGMNEADASLFYAQRQCSEYGKLGLMGTTILYSSGDDGVAGFGNECIFPNGTQGVGGTRFNPSFPGGCPFVTSVGATQVNPGSSVFAPESACEQVIFSGGGFSNFFSIPSYQKSQVASFLKNHPPPYTSAQFNNSGTSRGFPDLSANGANYVIAIDGEFELVFGTSASSPVVGSILTLVNDARLAIGKKPVGFINPTIYSEGFKDAFNDITTGGNQGCGTPGFTSAPGWDPVTGLGTPNFLKLLAKWLILP